MILCRRNTNPILRTAAVNRAFAPIAAARSLTAPKLKTQQVSCTPGLATTAGKREKKPTNRHLRGITMNKRLSTEELWQLCNREKWFESGTPRQYNALFDMNRSGSSLHDLAVVIWIYSTPCEKNTITGIENTLQKEIDRLHGYDR